MGWRIHPIYHVRVKLSVFRPINRISFTMFNILFTILNRKKYDIYQTHRLDFKRFINIAVSR